MTISRNARSEKTLRAGEGGEVRWNLSRKKSSTQAACKRGAKLGWQKSLTGLGWGEGRKPGSEVGKVRVGRVLTTQEHLGLNCDREMWLCEESRDEKKAVFQEGTAKRNWWRGGRGMQTGFFKVWRKIGDFSGHLLFLPLIIHLSYFREKIPISFWGSLLFLHNFWKTIWQFYFKTLKMFILFNL